MNIPFDQLPATSRLWIFPFDRTLSEAEVMQLRAEVSAFLGQWTAHNEALRAGCDLRYGRFLMVATDEAAAKASGCSIDELYRRIRMLGETFGIGFMNNLTIQFRDTSGNIATTDRAAFAKLGESGNIRENTIVFDNSITSLGALEKWEVPAKESWHMSLIGHRSPVVRQ